MIRPSLRWIETLRAVFLHTQADDDRLKRSDQASIHLIRVRNNDLLTI